MARDMNIAKLTRRFRVIFDCLLFNLIIDPITQNTAPTINAIPGSPITKDNPGSFELLTPILENLGIGNVVGVALKLISETEVTMDVQVKAQNPSFLSAIIDSFDVDILVGDYYVESFHIDGVTISPGEEQVLTIEGLTINFQDLLSIASEIVQNDFKIPLHFDITSHLTNML